MYLYLVTMQSENKTGRAAYICTIFVRPLVMKVVELLSKYWNLNFTSCWSPLETSSLRFLVNNF
jgi:hypothetical protein